MKFRRFSCFCQVVQVEKERSDPILKYCGALPPSSLVSVIDVR